MSLDTRTALVVGGGIYGLSTAWALARRGFKVTVLEAGPLPNLRQPCPQVAAPPSPLLDPECGVWEQSVVAQYGGHRMTVEAWPKSADGRGK